ncbi:hypothetical protein V8C37DRAFT_25502 [Trichoderma ceciliae]
MQPPLLLLLTAAARLSRMIWSPCAVLARSTEDKMPWFGHNRGVIGLSIKSSISTESRPASSTSVLVKGLSLCSRGRAQVYIVPTCYVHVTCMYLRPVPQSRPARRIRARPHAPSWWNGRTNRLESLLAHTPYRVLRKGQRFTCLIQQRERKILGCVFQEIPSSAIPILILYEQNGEARTLYQCFISSLFALLNKLAPQLIANGSHYLVLFLKL